MRILENPFTQAAKELLESTKQRNDLLQVTARDLVATSSPGTAAKTRVLIESTDGRREWGTVGVSENIIEASLQALVDSMEYALLKK